MTSVGVYELCNVHKEENPEPITKLKLFSFPPKSRLQETCLFHHAFLQVLLLLEYLNEL